MNLDEIWSLLSSHHYLPVGVFVVGYVLKLLSAESKFPLEVPPRWQPTVLLGLATLYGILTAVLGGERWPVAVEGGVSATLVVAILKAIYNGHEPKWFQAITFVLKSTPPEAPPPPPGSGTPPKPLSIFPPNSPPEPLPNGSDAPKASRSILGVPMRPLFAFVTMIAIAVSIPGCANAKAAENGALTAEQDACLVALLAAEILTGTPQQIATDILPICKIAPALTPLIVTIVTDVTGAKEQAKKLQESRKAKAPPAPLPPADKPKVSWWMIDFDAWELAHGA